MLKSVLWHAWLNLWEKHMLAGRINQRVFYHDGGTYPYERPPEITNQVIQYLHDPPDHKGVVSGASSESAWSTQSRPLWTPAKDPAAAAQRWRLYSWAEALPPSTHNIHRHSLVNNLIGKKLFIKRINFLFVFPELLFTLNLKWNIFFIRNWLYNIEQYEISYWSGIYGKHSRPKTL